MEKKGQRNDSDSVDLATKGEAAAFPQSSSSAAELHCSRAVPVQTPWGQPQEPTPSHHGRAHTGGNNIDSGGCRAELKFQMV